MKKLLHFIPTHLLCGFLLGILFHFYGVFAFPLVTNWLVCLVILFAFRFFWPSFWFIWLLSFLLGSQVFSLVSSRSPIPVSNGESVLVCIDHVLKPTSKSAKYYVKLKELGGNKVSGRLLMSVEKEGEALPFEIGTVVLVYGAIENLPKPRNPYGFDYGAYLRTKNIYKQLSVRKGMWELAGTPITSLKSIAANFRNSLIVSLQRTLVDGKVLSVSVAMLLGERQYISKEHMANFSDAGIVHLLAVSGLHVGILNYVLYLLFMPLQRVFRTKWPSLLLVLIGLWGFACIAGLSASVVRAVTMFSFVSIGAFFRNNSAISYSLVSSALLLLLFNPFYVFDLGFQMSYLAVVAIVVVQPRIYELWLPKYKFVRYFWSLATVSLAAQLGVLPLSLYYFHQFPGLFLVSNLLVIPFVGVLLVMGILVLLWSASGGGDSLLISLYNFMVTALNTVVSQVGSYDAFIWKGLYFSKGLLFAGYILMVFLILYMYNKCARHLYLVLTSVLVCQVLSVYEKKEQLHTERWVVFQQYKESHIVHSKNGVTRSWGKYSKQSDNNLQMYTVATGLEVHMRDAQLSAIYQLPEYLLFVVDKHGVYDLVEAQGAVVLLSDTPRINFERLLMTVQPRMVIADGSNYPSLKEKWRETCSLYRILFWDTSVSGAYVLSAV